MRVALMRRLLGVWKNQGVQWENVWNSSCEKLRVQLDHDFEGQRRKTIWNVQRETKSASAFVLPHILENATRQMQQAHCSLSDIPHENWRYGELHFENGQVKKELCVHENKAKFGTGYKPIVSFGFYQTKEKFWTILQHEFESYREVNDEQQKENINKVFLLFFYLVGSDVCIHFALVPKHSLCLCRGK